MRNLLNVLVIVLSAALGLVLIGVILESPSPARVRLSEEVLMQLGASGVTHPVTAVLLNFRGYDTLLEVMVLLLALLGVLAQMGKRKRENLPAGFYLTQPRMQVLLWLARVLVPLMALVAGYLLWAGGHQPGGAFQAGAVLAAAGVLLNLSGLLPSWMEPAWNLRAGLVSGLLVFLLIAAAVMTAASPGLLLQYPPASAGMLILLVETGLTLSLGLILAGLFLFLSGDAIDDEADK